MELSSTREVEGLQAMAALPRGREQTCPACHMEGWTPGAGRTVAEETVLQGFARVDLNPRFR